MPGKVQKQGFPGSMKLGDNQKTPIRVNETINFTKTVGTILRQSKHVFQSVLQVLNGPTVYDFSVYR